MINIRKTNAFVLLSTNHGMMIINKNDYREYKHDGKNVRNLWISADNLRLKWF